ncbi:class I SAM-dependent methyltransferase [Tunicatimonas pelagia]|uniref:class I SAM-dependent methyltransferase n=1 Tax=Tunicatimonas pelagia TaxID=931531 RepID=UPI00266675E1|nr:class I SAM-dependent methyltransferase [Tunicatimonas pelagia]WKN43825.1 methyltransferase domain-containing protein [Tunicatimonas pelagia]
MSYRWNTNLYQQKHAFVYQFGADLIKWLNPQAGEDILDLGCGTGELTEQIAQSGAKVIGIDQSEEMIQQAQRQHPERLFQVQNATQLSNLPQFDAIFSNATLHWILDARTVLKQIYQHLKPDGGRLVAELGGRGNIAQIITALNQQRVQLGYSAISSDKQWFFPSVGEYSSLLESEGFEVRQTAYFHRDTSLAEDGIKHWTKMFAGRWLADVDIEHQDNLLEATQESLRSALWRADYKRLRVLAVKV